MSSLTRYSSYERLMLGKQKLIECSSMQAFEKFKLEDKELKESLNSSMYASGVHGLSKCWSDGDENHLQEGMSHSFYKWTIVLCVKKQNYLCFGHFTTLSGHFFANYINIFHKI